MQEEIVVDVEDDGLDGGWVHGCRDLGEGKRQMQSSTVDGGAARRGWRPVEEGVADEGYGGAHHVESGCMGRESEDDDVIHVGHIEGGDVPDVRGDEMMNMYYQESNAKLKELYLERLHRNGGGG